MYRTAFAFRSEFLFKIIARAIDAEEKWYEFIWILIILCVGLSLYGYVLVRLHTLDAQQTALYRLFIQKQNHFKNFGSLSFLFVRSLEQPFYFVERLNYFLDIRWCWYDYSCSSLVPQIFCFLKLNFSWIVVQYAEKTL